MPVRRDAGQERSSAGRWSLSGPEQAGRVQESDRQLESGMAEGIHMLCVHEFPSVVGPPRHECDFAKMFHSDWCVSCALMIAPRARRRL